jgi:hypothetical protein
MSKALKNFLIAGSGLDISLMFDDYPTVIFK